MALFLLAAVLMGLVVFLGTWLVLKRESYPLIGGALAATVGLGVTCQQTWWIIAFGCVAAIASHVVGALTVHRLFTNS